MKQLLSLLLIISITIISWSSFAKSTVIKVNNLYVQSSIASGSILFQLSLSNQVINEQLDFTLSKTTKKHNEFFEATMLFNEKLQQFIAFFADADDDVKKVANNNLSFAKNSQVTNRKCKASSS